MIHNIKALGLALVAIFAMSAVVSSGASAAQFTAEGGYLAGITGAQTTTHVFTVQGHKAECKKATFNGTLAAASNSLRIFASYSECTAWGFVNATVSMNGCTYVFDAVGEMFIFCPEGSSITVTGGSCTVHIPAQIPNTNKVDYKNEGGNILITSTVEGIHSKVTKESFLCPLSANATDTTGKYTGSTLIGSTEGKNIHVK